MKKKNNTPTMEQWSKLYEVARNIKLQAPWNNLWDTDLFTIMLPGRKEPVYISVMGRNGECYGIGVYPGYRSIEGFYRLLDASPSDSVTDPLSFQNCLMCYYGNRDELSPKEREIIKSLGLKFRGENNWIYFRSIEEGFYPWFLNSEQVDLMTQTLQNFAMAYMHYSTGKIPVDFEGGHTLARKYSPERDEWLNASIPIPAVPEITCDIVFKDELLLQKLKAAKKNSASLELDILYLPMPVQDKPEETPYFPRLLVLMDHKSGELLAQNMMDKKMKNEEFLCYALEAYVNKYGKPGRLFVRDKYFLRLIDSFCSQTGIITAYGKGMPCVDEFAEQMTGFMGSEE